MLSFNFFYSASYELEGFFCNAACDNSHKGQSFVQTFYFIDRQKTYTRTKGVAKAVNQIWNETIKWHDSIIPSRMVSVTQYKIRMNTFVSDSFQGPIKFFFHLNRSHKFLFAHCLIIWCVQCFTVLQFFFSTLRGRGRGEVSFTPEWSNLPWQLSH